MSSNLTNKLRDLTIGGDDLSKIENAVLRGLRKANWNRLKERGSGETAAPADAAHGLNNPTPAIVATDSPHILGVCVHGVDLDRDFCPAGCRV